MTRTRIAISAVGAIMAAFAALPVQAHGFGERYDLPIPLNYFLVGAGAAVALSFVVIGIFVRGRPGGFTYPRYNLLGVPWLSAVLRNPFLLGVTRAASVALFVLVVATAFLGSQKPIENLSPTFVWIIWWVGTGYVVALAGNLWMLVNPWKITFEWAEKLFGAGRGSNAGMFRYPEGWDRWPAAALFFAFAWVENVYPDAATPLSLGLLIVLYSAITWGGMLAFGKHEWLQRGEAFSVLFGFFSRFSPTEVRVTDARVCRVCSLECNATGEQCVDCYQCFEAAGPSRKELNVRPYAVGLAIAERVSTATGAFVVLALATVTFDGLSETPVWVDFQSALHSAVKGLGTGVEQIVDTFGLALVPATFLAAYIGFSWAIGQLSGNPRPGVADVARAFVFSLVPIALAYNLAHFMSLLAIQGQLIIPLASDPFGAGWDLLGTADYRLNIGIIGARFVWFTSVVAIAAGHIISVYIAHIISLRRTPEPRLARRSQYPMLVLMVTYTATSLWIIAQPIVESG